MIWAATQAKVSKTASSSLAVLFVVVLLLIPSLSHAKPWAEHVAHLATQAKLIEADEAEIKELIEQKNHSSDGRDIQRIVQEISEKHKALEKVTHEYADEREHVRFSHPDKAETVERKYKRHEFKTLVELEEEIGSDRTLDRVKARVLATFPLPEKPKTAEKSTEVGIRAPASEPALDEPFERIHLVK